jgi:LCP family protein required for cell wall assembly
MRGDRERDTSRGAAIWTSATGGRSRATHVRAQRAWRRRRMRLLLRTAFVPGTGAWSENRRRRSVTVACALLVLGSLGIGAIAWHGGPVGSAISTRALAVLLGLNLAALAVRVVDLKSVERSLGSSRLALLPRGSRTTGRRVAPPPRPSRIPVLIALAIVTTPHLVVGLELARLHQTVGRVFPVASAAAATAEGEVSPDPPIIQATSLSSADSRQPSDPANTEPPETTDPLQRPARLPTPPDGTIDVLLIGLDSGAGRQGARNDANLVASIDPATGQTALIGIPRNLINVPYPPADADCGCFEEPLYALYRHGHTEAHRYPDEIDPGAAAVRDAASALLGREVEWYAVADMAAFMELVDALGGLSVEVREQVQQRLSDPYRNDVEVAIDVAPGRHHLDGGQALAYVRAREQSSDYVRMRRQRCAVQVLAEPVSHMSIREAVQVVELVRDRLVTDIPRDALPGLIQLARTVDTSSMASLGLTPPTFIDGRIDGYPIPDVDRIHESLRSLGRGHGPADDPAEDVCEPG